MMSSLFQRFKGLFGEGPYAVAARDLHMRIVEQSRLPAFYQHCAVPDTLDGRFDMIALHGFLVLHRLRELGTQEGASAKDLSQELFNVMFGDMDRGLRDLGSSDVRTPKRIKDMMSAFYGRVKAYEDGLATHDGALAEALERNIFRAADVGEGPPRLIAEYLRHEAESMGKQTLPDLLAGRVEFGPPPGG